MLLGHTRSLQKRAPCSLRTASPLRIAIFAPLSSLFLESGSLTSAYLRLIGLHVSHHCLQAASLTWHTRRWPEDELRRDRNLMAKLLGCLSFKGEAPRGRLLWSRKAQRSLEQSQLVGWIRRDVMLLQHEKADRDGPIRGATSKKPVAAHICPVSNDGAGVRPLRGKSSARKRSARTLARR